MGTRTRECTCRERVVQSVRCQLFNTPSMAAKKPNPRKTKQLGATFALAILSAPPEHQQHGKQHRQPHEQIVVVAKHQGPNRRHAPLAFWAAIPVARILTATATPARMSTATATTMMMIGVWSNTSSFSLDASAPGPSLPATGVLLLLPSLAPCSPPVPRTSLLSALSRSDVACGRGCCRDTWRMVSRQSLR